MKYIKTYEKLSLSEYESLGEFLCVYTSNYCKVFTYNTKYEIFRKDITDSYRIVDDKGTITNLHKYSYLFDYLTGEIRFANNLVFLQLANYGRTAFFADVDDIDDYESKKIAGKYNL